MSDSPEIVSQLLALAQRGVAARILPDGSLAVPTRSKNAIRQARYRQRHKASLTVTKRNKPLPEWMQSLHHDSAHAVINGAALCNASVPAGGRWVPHDGCLRKCTRCQGKIKAFQS